jgi:hypothetical protein
MPLAEHVGREQTFDALGRTYTLGRWTRAVWRGFVAWAKDQLPDPRVSAGVFLAECLSRIPDDSTPERLLIVKLAIDKATGFVGMDSPEVAGLLNTMDGGVKLLELLLKQHHPDVTEDDAYEIYTAVGGAKIDAMAQACAGLLPEKKRDPGGDGTTQPAPPASPPTGSGSTAS